VLGCEMGDLCGRGDGNNNEEGYNVALKPQRAWLARNTRFGFGATRRQVRLPGACSRDHVRCEDAALKKLEG
jgi:hypothetical protein